MTIQIFPRRLFYLFAAACLCVCTVSTPLHAQLLVRPSPGELQSVQKQLDPALLPAGATQLVVEFPQIFRLTHAPQPDTTIVPVHFRIPTATASQTTTTCGVFLVPVHGPATFQLLLGPPLTPQEQCLSGVEAVGAHVPEQSDKAIPIFIYKASTPHGTRYRPTILRWSYDANAYIFNPEGTQSLREEDHVPTTIKEVLSVWAHVD